MKSKIVYCGLTLLFTMGSMISIGTIVDNSQEPKSPFSTVTHADWPEKNFNELTDEADLIAVVQVKEQKAKEDPIGEGHFLERKYSVLEIKKLVKGEMNSEIVLNQALNYLEKNEKYLVFLRQAEDGLYYELTDDAILPYKEGKYISSIADLKADFKEEEIIEEINKKIASKK